MTPTGTIGTIPVSTPPLGDEYSCCEGHGFTLHPSYPLASSGPGKWYACYRCDNCAEETTVLLECSDGVLSLDEDFAAEVAEAMASR